MPTPKMTCRYVHDGVAIGEGLDAAPWNQLEEYAPFRLHDGSANSQLYTEVQACWDEQHLYIGFHCEDRDILAQMTERDAPLYNEEVVEVFIAPRERHRYFEFNVSPRNVLFDSLIKHDGTVFDGDPSWNCQGIKTHVRRLAAPDTPPATADAEGFGSWTVEVAIPFVSLGELTPRHGDRWLINFYRIKRVPQDEFSCWSPTLLEPAQFHVPSRFGTLLFIRN